MDAGKPPALELLDSPSRMWTPTKPTDDEAVIFLGPVPELLPALHGKTSKGHFTLFDSQWAGMSFGPRRLNTMLAKCAVSGVLADSADEPFIKMVTVDLPSLALLLGRNPIVPANTFPRKRAKNLTTRVDRRTWNWTSGSTRIEWGYDPTMTIGFNNLAVGMTARMVLTDSAPRSVNYWVHDWIQPALGLIEIATGAPAFAKSARCWTVMNPTDKHRRTLEPMLLHGGWIKDHDYEPKERDLLARAANVNQNPGGLPDVLTKLVTLNADHGQFVSLVLGAVSLADRPIHNKYLDLASALEAYHATEFGIGPAPARHEQTRDRILETIREETSLNSPDRSWLKRWIPKVPQHSLERRLRDLGTRIGVIERWEMTAEEMGQLRNTIAHGGVPGYREVSTAFDQAYALARNLILSDLGILAGPTE